MPGELSSSVDADHGVHAVCYWGAVSPPTSRAEHVSGQSVRGVCDATCCWKSSPMKPFVCCRRVLASRCWSQHACFYSVATSFNSLSLSKERDGQPRVPSCSLASELLFRGALGKVPHIAAAASRFGTSFSTSYDQAVSFGGFRTGAICA